MRIHRKGRTQLYLDEAIHARLRHLSRAKGQGLALWTRNRRDYPMPDLRFHPPP